MSRRKRDTAKAISIDPAKTVVTSEPFVDEGIVRAQQFQKATVLSDGACNKEFRFPSKRVTKILVKLRIFCGLTLLRLQVPQP